MYLDMRDRAHIDGIKQSAIHLHTALIMAQQMVATWKILNNRLQWNILPNVVQVCVEVITQSKNIYQQPDMQFQSKIIE